MYFVAAGLLFLVFMGGSKEGGARDVSPFGVKFSQFSCSFFFKGKVAKILGWCPTFALTPPQANTGSATGLGGKIGW